MEKARVEPKMIDLKEANKMLAEARVELEKRRGEFEALQSMIAGLEQWVQLQSAPSENADSSAPVPEIPSLRSTVIKVLRESGKPMHVKDVYDAAISLGARTASKDPVGITELTIIGLVQKGLVERYAQRTYKFVGPKA